MDLIISLDISRFLIDGKLGRTDEAWPLNGNHRQCRAPLRVEDDIPHRWGACNIYFNGDVVVIMVENRPNRMSEGDVPSLSPLIALASMKPALSSLDHQPAPALETPLFQAEMSLAMPTTSQYAKAREIVDQSMTAALP
jgi:hypothetical protein